MSESLKTIRRLPTSTAHQARLRIYEPTDRPKMSKREIVSAWGTATVEGRLGMPHAGVMEAALYCARAVRRDIQTGRMVLLIDPHELRTHAGGSYRMGSKRLKEILRDLKSAALLLVFSVESTKYVVDGGIIDEVVWIDDCADNPFGGRRAWMELTVAPAYAALMEDDIPRFYDPRSITSLKTAVGQAVARMMLGHSERVSTPAGIKIDTLLQQVGALKGGSATARKRRWELRRDEEGLQALGLRLQDDRLIDDRGVSNEV